jgi:hypothetical protein
MPPSRQRLGACHRPLQDGRPAARARRARGAARSARRQRAELLTEAEPAAAEARRDLRVLLRQLPDRQRLPIECVKIEGLSVAETARRTGLSESAVKVGVHRGTEGAGGADPRDTMKTDELIAALAAGAEPVDPRAPSRRMLLAAVAGALLAAPLMVGQLGLNPHLAQAAECADVLGQAGLRRFGRGGVRVALALGRPGVPPQRAGLALAIPFAAIWLLAAAVLVASGPEERAALLLGDTWRACPLNIAMLSAPALALALWALRGLAPTRPRLAGAAAGLLAGALGATVYTLHCPELAAPFIGTWYVLGMLIPVAAGAALGRRLLRW